MDCQLRVACGTGGEVAQHIVVVGGDILPLENREWRRILTTCGKVCPSIRQVGYRLVHAELVYYNQLLESRGLGQTGSDILDNARCIYSHHHFDLCKVVAVDQILHSKHVGCRDCDSTDLVQGNDADPELVAPLKDKHYHVAPLYAALHEEGGSPVGTLFHVAEGNGAFIPFVVGPYHSPCIRCLCRNGIHDIIGEVEVLGYIKSVVFDKILIGGKFCPW